MRAIRCLFVLTAFMLLMGCGPVYKRTYDYIPPKTRMGQMCIAQCSNNKSMCEQMCQMRNENCRARAHENAMYEFQLYQQEQQRRGEPVQKDIRDFDQSYTCSNFCDCGTAFHACYSACGGKVIEQQKCVAFCGS